MSLSNLASAATSSPNRVRFDQELDSPSSNGRPRRMSVPYPKVAQSKGTADRKVSFDLFWKLHTLSAVSKVVPVDAPEATMNEIAAKELDLVTADTKDAVMGEKGRPHSYIVLSRKQGGLIAVNA